MIFYIENPKDFTKKLLKLIKKFSKVAGHKSTHKNFVVLITPTTNYQKILRRQSHTQLHKKRIKCLIHSTSVYGVAGVGLAAEIQWQVLQVKVKVA